ncbi:MAG: SDR family NAD(P)-dependent oxidoreductase [Candidatus Abyssobacteria bacterium SURF_5]|uniref:3-dehydrosphinganine reductase n=1 Tax=Abyssobacteria bacterium (strain SURF_5) TaxID=2093360 RepID=A0A3A4NM81_ABYX5|nr:MAG: SDR family NAD(P)-dependent oxidoreductase [Candidatus Abyssubacteria bacterium SURF_5]
MDLRGKSAIITGGSSGIGKCLAKLLAQRGANIFIIARRDDVLTAACSEISANVSEKSQKVGCCVADVSDRSAVAQAIARAQAECGPAAMLVNCAGYVNPGYVEHLSVDSMEKEMRINYFGTIYTVKEVLDGMIQRRCGWILNVSSLGGLKGIFGYTGYSGSKFAVVGFSEALRSELRPYGISVAVLCPPDVDTPMFENENKNKPLETLRVSEGTKLMKPEDVAAAALKGLEQQHFLIIPNRSGKVFALVNRLAPWLVDHFLNKTINQVRKERGLQ